ncbi:hypothetical protein NC653_039684 [Populus alba x Populus x berolinensis]|uniref:Uncharacterized protein n=1 Tax=Populus alba x Populus x berolinensis TaxID=444605 RepID=A0AAD6LBR6_9ROSI|nr:hypothetical protein NC653_039684 [Populus alba x Populus x berolinensis]
MSDSTIDPESPVKAGRTRVPLWLEGFKRSHVVSVSGIPEFSYKIWIGRFGSFVFNDFEKESSCSTNEFLIKPG